MNHPEVWRQVPGFGDYQVSSRGRVASFRRKKDRILKPTRCAGGRLQVELFNDANRWKTDVARLVAEVFLCPRPPGWVIKHRDGDRSNNAAANLTYMSVATAIRHDFFRGRHPTKLTSEAVAAIRDGCLAHSEASTAAELFGVHPNTIYKVRKGLAWAWIPRSNSVVPGETIESGGSKS